MTYPSLIGTEWDIRCKNVDALPDWWVDDPANSGGICLMTEACLQPDVSSNELSEWKEEANLPIIPAGGKLLLDIPLGNSKSLWVTSFQKSSSLEEVLKNDKIQFGHRTYHCYSANLKS